MRWNKKAVSRSSPEHWLIFFAKAERKSEADPLIGRSIIISIIIIIIIIITIALSRAGESDFGVLVGADADDEVMEVDSSQRRTSDTYIGIVVGILAVVILLIVAISIVVGVRLRRKKYGVNGASPSKFVFASSGLRHRHDSVDYSQTLPLGAVRFLVHAAH